MEAGGTITLPAVEDTIRWYHRVLAAPLRAMADRQLGPLGGERSISSIIEGVLEQADGDDFGHPLSESERLFVHWFGGRRLPAALLEYRRLSHEVQRVILDRWGDEPLSVIWVGAGVFTLHHPLLARARPDDRHLWTEAAADVALEDAPTVDLRPGRPPVERTPVRLPNDIDRLNEWIERVTGGPKRLVVFAYGVGYALGPEENHQWLSRLRVPDDVDVCFVFNAPNAEIALLPGVVAVFCGQRMVHYGTSDVARLFEASVPGSRIVWQRSHDQTETGQWGTWLIERPAPHPHVR